MSATWRLLTLAMQRGSTSPRPSNAVGQMVRCSSMLSISASDLLSVRRDGQDLLHKPLPIGGTMEEAPDDGVMALPDRQEAIDMTTAAGEGRPAKRDPRRARRRGRPRKADAKASAPASGRRADGSKARQAFGAVQKMT